MRPGSAVPPHHIWKAPIVASSAANAAPISMASPRARPPARHMDHSPTAPMASAGA